MGSMLAAILSDKPFSASRNFFISALFWLLIGTTVGLIASLQFTAPDALSGVAQLSFGRIRPVHINTILVGWLSMGYVSCYFYLLPVLAKRNGLWSEWLGNLTCAAWNATLLLGVLAIANGNTEGREYAELALTLNVFGYELQLADWLVLVALLLLAFNCFMTVATGQEKKWYVSLWYMMGSLFWFPFVWIIGNRAFVQLDGLNDAIAGWFYGHNILGMWFTTGGVGIMYYLVPRFSGNPLYSHTLSMIGFWTIAMFYAPTGTHHILQSPVPEWLKAVAVIASVFLLVPVLTVLVNFFMTMKGKWGTVSDHIALRFAVAGGFGYLFTCMQGPFQATRFINWYLHFSQWVVGHAHMALLATFSFFVFACSYYMIPRILKRKMFSRELAIWHFWLSLLGWIIMMITLTIAGLVQAAGWHFAVPFDQWVIELVPYWLLRSFSGVLIVGGQILYAYNMYKTIFNGDECEPLPESKTGALYV
ncbi:MAG: cbb3-type cytochrome c oxidase subunit I [Cyanobacteria bacterium HKST-UBA06]|nr:cbb3-type cytochrome c oxidase subunit I [Cyanobacteria bacterium HKST-UBA06]